MSHTHTHTHAHAHAHTHTHTQRDGGCKRPPGVTDSLFTYRGRRAASARCAQPSLCRRDVSGSDERGHLCGETSLFTPCLPVCLSVFFCCSSLGRTNCSSVFFLPRQSDSTFPKQRNTGHDCEYFFFSISNLLSAFT